MSAKRKQKLKTRRHKSQGKKTPRNVSLDSLRGLAIVLMIVDHVAWLFFAQDIDTTSIRFWTRLSMPLFCVITGYLAARRETTNWERIIQVAIAAGVVNVAYFTIYGEVEILASLLVCYLGLAVTKQWFVVFVFAFLGFAWDPTSGVFNFPVSSVATCVAVGVVLQRWGVIWATAISLAIALVLLLAAWLQHGFELVTVPTAYVLLFLPLATVLVVAGLRWPNCKLIPLEFVGRYPLSVYVTQYLILLLASR